MCAQTIFTVLDYLNAWVVGKNKAAAIRRMKNQSQKGMGWPFHLLSVNDVIICHQWVSETLSVKLEGMLFTYTCIVGEASLYNSICIIQAEIEAYQF